MIRRLRSLEEVRAACGDDDLVMWAAQGLSGGSRAWALGGAVVAGSPAVSRHDRLAVWGEASSAASSAVALVRHALRELGASYRPLGEVELMRRVAGKVDGVREAAEFSWMSLSTLPDEDDGAVGWLDGEAAAGEVAGLLAADAPHSYAVPGAAGVSRWAGVRVDGVLAAVAAEAWSAPTVGLVAGVATRSSLRGRGLAGLVCRWVSRELVAGRGRAALMVDDGNGAAIRVYERIGYRRRRVLAAYVT
ncbi:GNAT family N-acetyltransferase [Nonomuraea sp. PA05]|uniref:GNAT family N-acetyltransferase n=1 Tax=Nonomuraea sp. PA05 TaxID=2604466 RepID=UPI0011DA87B8|nr:GNAT family N-acetyltransferase [Nonomuraea sp. PA05]TYB47534.1 GNAT family N-acetyltransferase [Nonomuraea sp. PA05]